MNIFKIFKKQKTKKVDYQGIIDNLLKMGYKKDSSSIYYLDRYLYGAHDHIKIQFSRESGMVSIEIVFNHLKYIKFQNKFKQYKFCESIRITSITNDTSHFILESEFDKISHIIYEAHAVYRDLLNTLRDKEEALERLFQIKKNFLIKERNELSAGVKIKNNNLRFSGISAHSRYSEKIIDNSTGVMFNPGILGDNILRIKEKLFDFYKDNLISIEIDQSHIGPGYLVMTIQLQHDTIKYNLSYRYNYYFYLFQDFVMICDDDVRSGFNFYNSNIYREFESLIELEK